MTQPYTYNQVIALLSSIATNHYQINHFGDGDMWETMESDIAAHKKFPLMWVRPISSTLEFPFSTIRMGIAVMDLVNTDESNENEVLSDTLLILQDIKALLSAPDYTSIFSISKSASLTPFTERYSAKVTGWAMELDVKVLWNKDRCAIPMSGAPTINNLCKPVLVYDQNGNLLATVPSGGTYTDSTLGANAIVKNSDNTFSQTIASGATYTLADTIYNVYVNGVLDQTTTQPSMIDLTINIT